jgi:hypothetical protein
MNPLISQVTGRGGSVQEDVPVPCAALPRINYRDRLNKLRRRRGEPVDDDGEDGSVSRALGENQKTINVIPDDAEALDPMEQSGGTITTRLNPIRDVVQEPTKPKDDDEKFTSPYTALTAPDATPDSLTQTDPSRLPGLTLDKFTSKQAAEGPEAPAAAPQGPASEISAPDAGVDNATHTMDVLLGRRRVGSPPSQRKPEEFQGMGAITTEAHALAALNITPTGAPVSGQALLGQGVEMPAPTAGDGKSIFEAARRFM